MTRMTPVTIPRSEIFRREAYTGRIPVSTAAPSRGIGGSTIRLPAGRNVLPPSSTTRATGSVFGGASGGAGAAATPLEPAMLSGISSSFNKASVDIMNTFGTLLPLAIKVILAIIVIKIVLWLIKRR